MRTTGAPAALLAHEAHRAPGREPSTGGPVGLDRGHPRGYSSLRLAVRHRCDPLQPRGWRLGGAREITWRADVRGERRGRPRSPIALPPRERASEHRTIDERLYVRFPALYRRLADASMRLPRSRLRRWIVARFARRAYAAANRRDFDLVMMGFGPESEYEYRPSADFIAPDQDPVFHGSDGYLRMWRTWLDAFDDLRFEPEELLDPGRHAARDRRGEGTRIGQWRRRQRAGVPALRAARRFGGQAGGLRGPLGGARSRWPFGAGDLAACRLERHPDSARRPEHHPAASDA